MSEKRDAAIDQLLERLNKVLEPKQPEKKGPWGFLNSSFCVTVLGGLVLWMVSAAWQQSQAEHEQARRRLDREYERKEKLLEEFAREFPYSIRLILDYKGREIWIAQNFDRPDDEDREYPDRRSFTETRSVYEKKLDRFFRRRPASSFAAEIKSTFHTKESAELADRMTKAMGDVVVALGAQAPAIVEAGVEELEEVYASLVASMAAELNRGGDPDDSDSKN